MISNDQEIQPLHIRDVLCGYVTVLLEPGLAFRTEATLAAVAFVIVNYVIMHIKDFLSARAEVDIKNPLICQH